MSQNREPPAYMEYASTRLASMGFRLATLHERGLWWTMLLECWANHRLPSDPETLAAYFGLPYEDVEKALQRVLKNFVQDGEWLSCPELDDYRRHLEERRRKQSEGGKEGAEKTNKGKARKVDASTGTPTSHPAAIPAAKPQGARRGMVASLIYNSQSKDKKNQNSNQAVDLSTPAWIDDNAEGEQF